MIWENYVFRRGVDAEEMWDQMHAERLSAGKSLRLLYIAGRGFDLRANLVLERFVDRLKASQCSIESAKLLLTGFIGYQLADDLVTQTNENSEKLKEIFSGVGQTEIVEIGRSSNGEDDITAAMALRQGADDILRNSEGCTDIVLDVSSLPRILYLTILLSLLAKLVPTADGDGRLYANGVVLHVLVGEDAVLDAKISSEDPANDIVLIPGYAEALQAEALQDTPLVWLPILGENRLAQLKKIEGSIPSWAEICPVLPHPSRNPRRGDELVLEYSDIFAGTRETPLTNILYVHESHPFETYRQLLDAMLSYQ